eukprot:UN30837
MTLEAKKFEEKQKQMQFEKDRKKKKALIESQRKNEEMKKEERRKADERTRTLLKEKLALEKSAAYPSVPNDDFDIDMDQNEQGLPNLPEPGLPSVPNNPAAAPTHTSRFNPYGAVNGTASDNPFSGSNNPTQPGQVRSVNPFSTNMLLPSQSGVAPANPFLHGNMNNFTNNSFYNTNMHNLPPPNLARGFTNINSEKSNFSVVNTGAVKQLNPIAPEPQKDNQEKTWPSTSLYKKQPP